MRTGIAFGRLLPVLLALTALAVSLVATGAAAGGGQGKKPQKVKSRDDGATEKLAPELQAKLESGSMAPVAVVATIQNGDPAQATALLTASRTASKNGVALVVGNVAASKLAKLGGVKGVVSVSAVEFRQTAWQTWQQADVANLGAHPGWVGWPKAFDPYDTLVMALAPNMIDAGLTWYTTTTAAGRTPVEHPLKNGNEAKPTKRSTRGRSAPSRSRRRLARRAIE